MKLCISDESITNYHQYKMESNINDINISNTTTYVIGISGCTGSGKSFVCDMIKNMVEKTFTKSLGNVTFVHQDSYYLGGLPNRNYDVPESIDFDRYYNDILELKSGKSIKCPVYDFTTHSRKDETETLLPAKIIIIEGILIFTQQKILDLCDKRVFISASELIRYFRRKDRDTSFRGRSEEEVKKRWLTDIRNSESNYVLQSVKHTHLEINNDDNNNCKNMDILLHHIIIKILELNGMSIDLIIKKYIS